MEKHFRDDKSSRRNENGSEFEEIDTDCNFLKNISSVGQKNTLQTIIDPEGTRMAQNLRGLTQIVKKLKN